MSEGAGGRTLVLWRHGRTAWNHARRIQGHADVDLDDLGHSQAATAARELAKLGADTLWCSDLSRARVTCSYLTTETGLAPTIDARLREYHLGEREGMTHDEYVVAHPEEYARFRTGNWAGVPGAESAEQVRHRMIAVLSDLAAATPEGGLGIAVSHGAAIREAVAGLLDWPTAAAQQLRGVDNCGWVVLEEAVHGWRLAAYNRVAGV